MKHVAQVLLREFAPKFQQRAEIKFSSPDCFSYMRTQLKVFEGWVFFLALFSQRNIFTWRGHLKELKLETNLFVYSQMWTAASLTSNKPKHVRLCKFKIFFFWRAILVQLVHCIFVLHYYYSIMKTFCNFSLQLNMTKNRHFGHRKIKYKIWEKLNSLGLVAFKRWSGHSLLKIEKNAFFPQIFGKDW